MDGVTKGRRAMRFTGKVAIVTGAGRGIGRAIALAFAAEGAKVVVSDVHGDSADRVARLIRDLSQDALAVEVDVSKASQVARLAQKTLEAFGTIDVLVNNAGVLRPTRLEDISEEEWDWLMDINVKGVFLCTKAVLPTMRSRGGGKIVNLASIAGRSTSTIGGAHYTTSKAAVLGLTRHAAREMAQYHVNVNSVSPGSIDTEMVREYSTAEEREEEAKNVPLGRFADPQEVARVVLFLASQEASYITGATIDINGGLLMI